MMAGVGSDQSFKASLSLRAVIASEAGLIKSVRSAGKVTLIFGYVDVWPIIACASAFSRMRPPNEDQ